MENISKNLDGSFKIIPGRTCVEVYQVSEDGRNENLVKQGVVTQNLGTFLRVYDPRPVNKGGDPHHTAETFALSAKRSYIRIVSELKESSAVKIPPSF